MSIEINNHIQNHVSNSIKSLEKISKELTNPIKNAVDIITNAFKNDNKLLIAGNGGSAADAQHIAAEFIVRLDKNNNRKSLPAIALSTDTSIITAGGNDFGFDKIFARQLEGLGQKNDVFMAISTSGNSGNLVSAVEYAKDNGIKTIGLLGSDGGKIKNLIDLSIIVRESNTQHIQEAHICIYHIICELVEKNFLIKTL